MSVSVSDRALSRGETCGAADPGDDLVDAAAGAELVDALG